MPRAELETPEETQELEEEILDETPEEEEVASGEKEADPDAKVQTRVGKKVTKPRRLLHPENVYYFPVADGEDVKTTLRRATDGLGALKYQDQGEVVGFRTFNVVKDGVRNEDNDLVDGEIVGIVLSRNADNAARNFAQAKGYEFTLARKFRKGKGRGRTKIEHTSLMYGKLLEKTIFDEQGNMRKGIEKQHTDAWNELYAPGGKYGHYKDDDGNWKEATA